MINVFTGDINSANADEFYKERRGEKEEKVFDEKVKARVSYRKDGRRELDGIVESSMSSNTLWSAAITRGVAHEWKDRSKEGRFTWAAKYLKIVQYEVRDYIARHHYVGTTLLVLLNLFLFYVLYRML